MTQCISSLGGPSPLKEMITFEVVKEPYGWAVRRDRSMMTPFWCKDLAIAEAGRMVDALRRHGAKAEIRIAEDET